MRLESLKPLFIHEPETDQFAVIMKNRNERLRIFSSVKPKSKKAKAKPKKSKLDRIAAGLNPEDFLKLLEE